ncbi:hypothetical protein BJ912DRAFT_858960 [Pholiota molesta]|nr:hypothetical protein BJ912DRAFT_858960 [Pholiota molesta]
MASSDSIMFTPTTERKLQRSRITQKRLETYSKNKETESTMQEGEKLQKQRTRERIFDEVLAVFQEAGITLAEFLQYVFKPKAHHIFDWKWRGFFQHRETVKEIFSYWTTAEYNKTTRTFIMDWIVSQAETIVRAESKTISESKILRKTSMTVNEHFFLDYSLEDLTKQLRELAPTAFTLFDAFSTTKRQLRELKEKSLHKQELVRGSAILALLRSRSRTNNYAQAVIGTYLMATGSQRQHFTVFSSLGISMSYNSVVAAPSSQSTSKRKKDQSPGTLHLLSHACRDTARNIASTGLFITVYDNINMMIRVAEQVLGRKNAQENGTCATVIPLYNAKLEDIETRHLDNGIMNAPPLKLENLLLTENESHLMEDALVHTILSVIVHYGGESLKRWKGDLVTNAPRSREAIAVHKSSLHPLPSMEIDENTIKGNIEIIEAINTELKLANDDPERGKHLQIIAGDQLTIARQRAITGIRLGHEVGLGMWKNFVLVTGLFHTKIADTHGTLLMHFGVSSNQSPGSLAFHNTCLTRLPIVLTSLPSFRICRDLIMVSLYARILHCLLLVSEEDSLESYAQNVTTWSEIKEHSLEILTKFASADRVQELREPRLEAERRAELQGDMVFENACLFLRDALLTRLFADAVKSGDSGLVILVLKHWVFSFRGNGRSKYAHEMLHLFHNLVNVWTKEIRKVVTQNWLLNPTGKENAFVEIDLVQEHLNFWIKRVYKAEGGSHSWDWLALVSPCVDILRKLSTKINHELGMEQGSKHTVPDLSKDISSLMTSLAHHSVYKVINGREVDKLDCAVPDVISVGMAQLAHGKSTSPIAEFNEQFDRLRERRKLTAVFENEHDIGSPSLPATNVQVDAMKTVQKSLSAGNTSEHNDLPTNEARDADESAGEADQEEIELEFDASDAFLMASPTLERIDEYDVELDMDGWDLEEDSGEDDDEDMSEESDEEDGAFDFV